MENSPFLGLERWSRDGLMESCVCCPCHCAGTSPATRLPAPPPRADPHPPLVQLYIVTWWYHVMDGRGARPLHWRSVLVRAVLRSLCGRGVTRIAQKDVCGETSLCLKDEDDVSHETARTLQKKPKKIQLTPLQSSLVFFSPISHFLEEWDFVAGGRGGRRRRGKSRGARRADERWRWWRQWWRHDDWRRRTREITGMLNTNWKCSRHFEVDIYWFDVYSKRRMLEEIRCARHKRTVWRTMRLSSVLSAAKFSWACVFCSSVAHPHLRKFWKKNGLELLVVYEQHIILRKSGTDPSKKCSDSHEFSCRVCHLILVIV